MPAATPEFSIIIPTRDRPQQLKACLESLSALDYPRECFEVIVVDDGSAVPVEPYTASFRDRLRLTVVRQPHGGPGRARNHGAACATGEFLAFTDDDCAAAPDWISKLAARFCSIPGHLIGGGVVNALTDDLYAAACHTILDAAYSYYDPREGRAHFFPTSNIALAASRFREMGGFDPHWPLAAAEDREFCYRWLQAGHSMTYAPDAIIHHHHALHFASFCRLHFKYGRGAFQYQRLRAGREGAGGLKPAWQFYRTCFQYPFGRMPASRAIAVAGLLVVWQLANAAGYFSESSRPSG